MYKRLKIAAFALLFFVSMANAEDQNQFQPRAEYKIIHDPAIRGIYQSGKNSLSWFNSEIEKRKSAENDGKPYKTRVLKITLQNLTGFTQHILDDKQFQTKLTDDERKAYGMLLFDLNGLDTNEPEYIETIRLSNKLAFMYERSVKIHFSLDGYLTQAFPEKDITQIRVKHGLYFIKGLGDLSLTEIYNSNSRSILTRFINDRTILLLPSFEPLSVGDFAGFSHLRLYPLGLVTSYLTEADGLPYFPHAFFEHDIFHTSSMSADKDLLELFGGMESVFDFNQLLFREAKLFFKDSPNIMKTLQLALFVTFHETPTREKFLRIPAPDNKAVLQDYLSRINSTKSLAGDPYESISYEEVNQAVLWFASIYQYWKSTDKPSALSEKDRLSMIANYLSNYHHYRISMAP